MSKADGGGASRPDAILLGEGMLTWMRHERVSDRYGAVYIRDPFPDDWGPTQKYMSGPVAGIRECIPPATDGLEERRGRLVVEVTRSRQSDHVGDLFRHIGPPNPPVPAGTRIVLGWGRLFTENEGEGIIAVGLYPSDDRQKDWLDPRELYRAHEQDVRLYFEPDEEPDE